MFTSTVFMALAIGLLVGIFIGYGWRAWIASKAPNVGVQIDETAKRVAAEIERSGNKVTAEMERARKRYDESKP